uniref:DDT domain-containing protein DDR4 n=1 Tax=Kalanchoe fedtschenkoi TaxID=63787 RepID=A0A7N0TA66_KALFE
MATGRRRQVSATPGAEVVVEEAVKKGGGLENGKGCAESPLSEVDAGVESARTVLRQRWELATVINFLNVFGPVIGPDVKMSAEEIETGLINPDEALGKLHVALLKGIPPISRNLDDSDAWVTFLCKKLNEWWPWVAEGKLPLSPSNGEEIIKYKELDPATRLLMLKALCELRADQDDAVSYINEELKNGTELSYFRKDNIGKDSRGATYWCANDAAHGYRLYKEVKKLNSRKKLKANGYLNDPNFSVQWETIATNLQEFRKIVDELSSSKYAFEVAIGRAIENDALAALEKIEKRKERALKKQQRLARLMGNYRNSSVIGITRSCRNRRPITYTYDDYDKAINEAIQITQRRKATDELKTRGRFGDHEQGVDSVGNLSSDAGTLSENNSAQKKHKSENSHHSIEGHNKHIESDGTDEDYDGKKDSDQVINGDESSYTEEVDNVEEKKKLHSQKQKDGISYKHFGSRRLTTRHPVSQSMNPPSRRRLRQRPVGNSAMDTVVPDSEDEGIKPMSRCKTR